MFYLEDLPYSDQALEPYISASTISFHYGKHHKTYVDNLNKLLAGSSFEHSTLEEIVKNSDGGIFNNGAQVWNHSFYWQCLKPGTTEPSGLLMDSIRRSFGDFELFKQEFTRSALTLFGSGWVWLVINENGILSITQESNAGNPMRKGLKPLMTCDVWEHAYYLDKQNRRAEYVEDFWNILNWEFVEKNFLEK